jgi:hypothetical protein
MRKWGAQDMKYTRGTSALDWGNKEDHEQKQRGGLFQTQNSNTGKDNQKKKKKKNRKTEKKDQKKTRRNRGAPADQVSHSSSLPVL